MAWIKKQDNSGGRQSDYLNAADTAGRPMVLASILFTLLFIAAIALLLFSAGKWAYNQFIQNDNTLTTTSQPASDGPATDSGNTTSPENGGTNEAQTSTENSTQTETNNQNSPNDAASSAANGNTAPSNTSSNATPTTGSTESAPVTAPITGPVATEAVPNTGPGSVLGIFAVSVILATIAYNRWLALKMR